jgi:hypothetical protein
MSNLRAYDTGALDLEYVRHLGFLRLFLKLLKEYVDGITTPSILGDRS